MGYFGHSHQSILALEKHMMQKGEVLRNNDRRILFLIIGCRKEQRFFIRSISTCRDINGPACHSIQ